ncbi:hypothetical protein HYPSUDRAFT_49250 [Hypholoma sublateritium FD-334 SS-4]|uniref:Uncharacterized protein n=1 Tax=Hypholoma sublateritium (strain FD-334 SS-4) TaxID=945553 RepID=A0A0D2KIB3_HYPSF|nr:hypothetical protein HYPSUDRAFT_49250 [Hypholoma sublateritium FD-334 SS-4]
MDSIVTQLITVAVATASTVTGVSLPAWQPADAIIRDIREVTSVRKISGYLDINVKI